MSLKSWPLNHLCLCHTVSLSLNSRLVKAREHSGGFPTFPRFLRHAFQPSSELVEKTDRLIKTNKKTRKNPTNRERLNTTFFVCCYRVQSSQSFLLSHSGSLLFSWNGQGELQATQGIILTLTVLLCFSIFK